MNDKSTPTEDVTSQGVPWTPLAGLVILLIFLLLQVFLSMVDVASIPDDRWMGVQMALGSVGLFLIIAVFVRLRAGSCARAMKVLRLHIPGFKKFLFGPLKPLLIGFPILVLWMISQGLILQHFNIEPPAQPVARWFQEQTAQGLTPWVVLLIFLAVVGAPVTEELLFRGVIYLPMRGIYGAVKASVIVSLIFAGVHGYAAGVGHLFILAMILAWLLETTETMIWPILVHGLHNATMIALMFFFGQALQPG